MVCLHLHVDVFTDIIGAYVDDFLVCSDRTKECVDDLVRESAPWYRTSNLGVVMRFLGAQVDQTPTHTDIYLEKYISDSQRTLPVYGESSCLWHGSSPSCRLLPTASTPRWAFATAPLLPFRIQCHCVPHVDSSQADDKDTHRSTAGYALFVAGGALSWRAFLETIVALSSTKAELIALTEGLEEVMYKARGLGRTVSSCPGVRGV